MAKGQIHVQGGHVFVALIFMNPKDNALNPVRSFWNEPKDQEFLLAVEFEFLPFA
jgi:hypothetical protein